MTLAGCAWHTLAQLAQPKRSKGIADALWHELEGDQCADALVRTAESLSADAETRRSRYFAAASLYEQRPISNETMGSSGWYSDVLYNVSRSGVDTAQAEVASRQRPKPMFLTSGADWKTKRRAKKLDRFVEATLHQTQGARYADAWELTEDAFRDAMLGVGGVVKVVVDVACERIRLERVPPYEIRVDPIEAAQGNPQNWFHVYEISESAAIAQFVGDKRGLEADRIRAMIHSAARNSKADTIATQGRRTTRSVEITEGWFMPPSANEPGKHAFACSGGMLHEDAEWDWPWPPLAIIVWTRETFGIWGMGLVEEGANQHRDLQEFSEKLQERSRLCGHRRTYIEQNSVDQEAMKRNDAETFIVVQDISKVPRPEEVPVIGPSDLNLLEFKIAKYYEMRGLSQMSASARKDPGVDAAVAMQTLNDIKSVRFMSKARAYELLFVRLGEIIVKAARDLAVEMGGNFTTQWPGKKFIQEIDWKDVDLKEDMYQVRVAPVSAMSRDPAQRLQLVEQLSNMGFLPREKYLELMQLPDLDSWLESENSASEWLERIVERYLDADDDKHLKKMGGFVQPDGYLPNPKGALATVAQHYFSAMAEGVPEYNAELLRQFLKPLVKMVVPPAAPPMPGMSPGAAMAGPATMALGAPPPPAPVGMAA